MPTLVTGAAGFIGACPCRAPAARGEGLVGPDNDNDGHGLSRAASGFEAATTIEAGMPPMVGWCRRCFAGAS